MFAIEEQEGRGYKKVHAAGCRDLRDPEVIGEASTKEALITLLDGWGSAEEIEELDHYLAPCARSLLAG